MEKDMAWTYVSALGFASHETRLEKDLRELADELADEPSNSAANLVREALEEIAHLHQVILNAIRYARHDGYREGLKAAAELCMSASDEMRAKRVPGAPVNVYDEAQISEARVLYAKIMVKAIELPAVPPEPFASASEPVASTASTPDEEQGV